jgi:hypothetical protein
MLPNAKKFFLTVEDLVELAELNTKYRDYYLPVDEFCVNLCAGKYSLGSGISNKLKDLNERVKELEDELNFKLEMEENLIEEDMNNLKDMLFSYMEDYFKKLKVKLKEMFHSNNAELKESLVEANQILKQELLKTMNENEFFDLSKFFVQFNEMKDEPEEFEVFLRDYVNNDKAVQFSKDAISQYEKMSPIFNEEFDIDAKMSNYVLNIEKLSHHFIPHEDDMATVLEGFSKAIMKQIDTSMMKARHFTNGDAMIYTDAAGAISPSKDARTKVVMTGGSAAKRASKMKKPTNEIDCITFKNCQDLQYDHLKFNNSSVNKAVLELHGDNLNQKSCEHLGVFVGSLFKLDQLKMNFSM